MTSGDSGQLLSQTDLARLQLTTLQYYLHETNPVNGLIRDKTQKDAYREHCGDRPGIGIAADSR